MKFLMIGAHPDDTDLRCGGLAIQLVRHGHQVRFLSLTTGNAGHQSMSRDELRQRRQIEMTEAGKVYGVRYDTLGIDDGYLTADIPTREKLLRYIRHYAPDVIFTHRTCDYHPDHRAAGQLVNDCSYMVCVPLVCPDAPAPRDPPVILAYEDGFTVPAPFRADIAVCCDDVINRKIEGVLKHVSQFYEWLAYNNHWDAVLNAQTDEEKKAYLTEGLKMRFSGPVKRYPEKFAAGAQYGEVFQIDEYGGKMTDEIMSAITGHSAKQAQ